MTHVTLLNASFFQYAEKRFHGSISANQSEHKHIYKKKREKIVTVHVSTDGLARQSQHSWPTFKLLTAFWAFKLFSTKQ